jgi:putative ABC transport system permease protein
VSETIEQRFWPGGDATGKRFRFNGPIARNPWMEIVGVVNDVRHELNMPFTGDYYLPHKQDPWENMVLVARTSSEPLALSLPIRNEVLALDKSQPVFDIKTMKQVRAQSILPYSISGTWLSIFGFVALALAAVGIYGVMSYSVSQRTHEIGVRMALGARPRDVMRMVIKQGLTLVSIGLGVGLLGGVALRSVMESLLFGTGSTNTITFVLVSLVLAATALVACFIPARRATKVDPMVALRYE